MSNPTPYKIDVERYFRMAEAGIFREGERIELIEGEILEMAPIGPPHNSAVARFLRLLFGRIPPSRAEIWTQATMILSDLSAPEPDILLLKPRADGYRTKHPRPPDVLVAIEVSQSSLAYDRGRKSALYARHGIPENWILDVAAETLEVRTEPGPHGYASSRLYERGTPVAAAALPDILIDWGVIFD